MQRLKHVGLLRTGVAAGLCASALVATVAIALKLDWIPNLQRTTGFPPTGGGSSIVKVHGGSIHGEIAAPDVWTKIQADVSYSAEPRGGDDHIRATGFDEADIVNLTDTGGWTIYISNADGNGHEVPAALKVCSDQNCTKSSASNGVVYVSRGIHGVRLSKYSDTEIRFHDDHNCDHGGNVEDLRCDKIVHSIISTRLKGSYTLSCSDPGQLSPSRPCVIEIGQ